MSRFNSVGRILLLSWLGTAPAFSQSDSKELDVFGYFQGAFDHTARSALHKTQNTFILQQLNCFLSKPISARFGAFVNFELTNSFSSERNWGSFNLEEAWVKYYYRNSLTLKGGLLIPTFNNLNEIKNRTPLLSYIYRPIVYEASISEMFTISDYLPERAFLQAYGFVAAGQTKVDYAIYVGNSETPFLNSTTGNYARRGVDTTLYKLVGGRLGVRTGALKAGVSVTFDRDNQNALGLGAVRRTRIGADMSYRLARFTGEGEVIVVSNRLTSEQSQRLAFISRLSPQVGNSLDKLFYYGCLNCDMTDRLFAYARYDYVEDKLIGALEAGLVGQTFGGGYRANDAVVLKAQFFRIRMHENPVLHFQEDHYLAAVSVFF